MRIPSTSSRKSKRNYIILGLCILLLAVSAGTLFSQRRTAIRVGSSAARAVPAKNKSKAAANRQLKASERWINLAVTTGENGEKSADGMMTALPVEVSMETINAAQREAEVRARTQPKIRLRKGRQNPDRSNLPEGPGAQALAQWPADPQGPFGATIPSVEPLAPQTLGTQFDGATGPTETGAFPPDTMGAVGPTQVVIFLNGRLRTFNKTTGVADAAINADSDVFFASVMTPPLAGEVVFTSDPQVRFDRLSNRWFLNIIDVVLNSTTGAITRPNRVLLAVCDAASNGTITAGTVWTFYQFQGDATLFTDYQSLGIDSSALYIGGDMFTLAGGFNSTKGFVIPKAPLLTASPATVWAFSGMVATPTGAGPFAPRGVDNYATAASTEGYFIGVDNATFNTLMLRRITNPGSLGPAPTISANISIATSLTTRFPLTVNHLGDTGGTNGNLDALDDRLYYAHIRNGRLWTSHNIGVNSSGVAGASNTRNASRWYELQNIISPGTPSVLQSGTLFDNSAGAVGDQRNYWIPSILVSGQGHAALGCSIAGTNERINAFTTGRLSGDTLGTLRDGPGGIAFPGYTASATAYNPPGDPGPIRRWGDYSNTSLDPKDDMTMWTIQEYCNGTNTYGVRAVKLIAPPPPPTNTSNPAFINLSNPSRNLVITGTAPAGQGFYDPGPDPAAPHTPFTHISASGVGIIVNSITYNSPTQVTINVSTVGSTPGAKTITITNPDGQTTTVSVTIGPTAAPASISGRITTADGAPLAGVTMNLGGGQSLKTISDASGYYRFASADTDNFYTLTPSLAGYHFSPENRSFSLLANMTDAVFTGTRDAVVTGNAIDSAEYFVRQHYLDFLAREPDESGFAFWSNQIAECGNDAGCVAVRKINVSAAYFLSIEFAKTGGLVDGLYRASYARPPLYAEFMPDTQTVARNVIVDRGDWAQTLLANKQTFIDAWVQRAEFRAAFDSLSNERYVDKLIANTGVSFSAAERNELLSGLADNSLTRAAVLGRIVENEAFIRAKQNEMFVMMEYFGYLRRDPDPQGFQFWLNKLNQFNGNFVQAEMVKAFINSGEYRQRFGVN